MQKIIKSIFVSSFALIGLNLFAFNVTFRVDMSNETGFVNPELNGTFNNWCGSCAAMSNIEGTAIWEITIDLPAGNHEYKFSYDNWSGQEILPAGSPCTVTVGSFTNRIITVNSDMELPLVCFGTCSTCVEPEPIWVDIYLNPGTNAFNDVSISGSFNSFCATCEPMELTPEGLWKASLLLPAGNYTYIFRANNGTLIETLGNALCTVAGQGGLYRQLTVVESASIAPVCWDSCNDCEGGAGINEAWQLYWSEDFNGNALDTDTWNYDLGASGWGNNEWQNYTSSEENCLVSNGTLKITARKNVNAPFIYTSSRIQSNNKFEFQYGKVEARIKIPMGQGIWPAFWMLGANFETVGWPQCGEIDIMEHVNNENMTHGTVHWNNNGHQYTGSSISLDPTEWHVYGVLWDHERVRFYVDGTLYNEFVYSQNPNSTNIFQNPFFFILNVAVGGNWPGYPDDSTPFPATMEVDFVRVYQQQTVGINETEQTFGIYPNPAANTLNLQVMPNQLNKNYFVFNSQGQQVQAGKINAVSTSIPVNNLADGIYFISIENNKTQRFVIQKTP